ncbi:MAG TPA: CBS domain-containing protein [Beijerinckiaceae bacterium]
MTVERILETKGRDVVTIAAQASVGEAARVLAERRIGAIVVTDGGGEVRGIVSERDVVRVLATQGVEALDRPIASCMTSAVVTTTHRTTLHSLMQQMTAGRFRHMPVVEGGRLVGIISIGDVVKHRLEEMESEQQALREYIATA